MKFLFTILSFIIIGKVFSQSPSFPTVIPGNTKTQITINQGSPGTLTGFTLVTNFSDTSEANVPSYIRFTPGILIRVSDTLWMRDVTATHWIKQGGAGGSGGSGSPNSNIGSGYRYAVANTNNIKTSFPGLYMLIDSSSNSNGLTYKVDSATMFPVIRSTIESFKNPMTTLGDFIYGGVSGLATRFAGNIQAVKKIPTWLGNGSVSAAPTFDTAAVITTAGGTVGQSVVWNGAQNFILGATPGADSIGNQQFNVGDANAPPAGDSTYNIAGFAGKKIEVYRYGELQSVDTVFGVSGLDTSTGSFTVHPPYEAGEKIIVKSYRYGSVYSVAPGVWSFLTFGTVTHLINTSNVWTSDISSTWAATGLDAKHLSGDGAIRAQYAATDGIKWILGFNLTNANQGFADYEYGVFVSDGGELFKLENGSASSLSIFLTVNDYAGLFRTGSTVSLQTSTNGVSWTTRYTFPTTTSATLYVNLNVYLFGDGKCYYPQGFRLE